MMEDNMKDSIEMIRNMDLEFINGQMVDVMKGIG